MALVNATLQVDFVAEYAGPHRVCWTITGGAPYDCSTIVNCIGGGAPCQALIPIQVDSESCDGPITFDGYVQATCRAESDPDDRIPFSEIFTPDPQCKRWVITADTGGIGQIAITNPGAVGEYNPLAPPAVTIGGAGVGATATSTVGDGTITDYNIINKGWGYLVGETVNIIDATGPGAAANVEVGSVDGNGSILTLNIIAPGAGYEDLQVLGISTAGGSGGLVDVLGNNGQLIRITTTAPGSGYAAQGNQATVPGSGQLSPDVEYQDDIAGVSLGNDCIGADNVSIPAGSIKVGESIAVCLDDGSETLPPPPATFSAVNVGCCTDNCIDYHILNSLEGESITIQWLDCGGDVKTLVIAGDPDGLGGGNTNVCAVEGSLFVQNLAAVYDPSKVVITESGDCP